MMSSVEVEVAKIAESLLLKTDHARPINVTTLSGGRNNSVHLLNTSTRQYVLKRLFHSKDDLRDRFLAETCFYAHCESMRIESVPKLFVAAREYRSLLLEFVEGYELNAQDVSDKFIQSALSFLIEINAQKKPKIDLPPASESCLSIDAHIELIDNRISKLEQFVTDNEARLFVFTKLRPVWDQLVRPIAEDCEYVSKLVNPFISPSDFGFHNCLIRPNATAVFYDFEYAGWDDPAKLICDFFCQVEVPVPISYFDFVLDQLHCLTRKEDFLADRTRRLLPAFKIKWCCILLNEFLQSELARRQFSDHSSASNLVESQLAKASTMLDEASRFANDI